MASALIVLRHNIHLETDIELAVRELDCLMGKNGARLAKLPDVLACLPRITVLDQVEFARRTSIVAVYYEEIRQTSIRELALRSAFAQEVFVTGSASFLDALATSTTLPSHLINEISGQVLVILPLYYLIEVEGSAGSVATPGRDRLEEIGRLLLEPFAGIRLTPTSKTLRKSKKTTLSLTHDLHIYKAKFFPRMVRALLNIFAQPDSSVLDPFCGSGTALLEASLLGHTAFGLDVDPICALISETKVTPFAEHPRKVIADIEVLRRSLAVLNNTIRNATRAGGFPRELLKKLELRDARDDTAWTPEVLADVETIRRALAHCADTTTTNLPRVIASDAVTKKIRYRFVGVGNGRYTIEVVKIPLLSRFAGKLDRCSSLVEAFRSIGKILPWPIGTTTVCLGDARDKSTWPCKSVNVIITSPPYLPASSGREHYATSRSLAFYTLGLDAAAACFDPTEREADLSDGSLDGLPESKRLLDYLNSDSAGTDPQRDPMRYLRKAKPTKAYLEDMLEFFRACRATLSDDGVLLLVVASQHGFYSHRRGVIEHVVNCKALYGELAEKAGLRLREEIRLELLKAANSRARPRAKDRYFESVLVFGG
jgi:DNA methylase